LFLFLLLDCHSSQSHDDENPFSSLLIIASEPTKNSMSGSGDFFLVISGFLLSFDGWNVSRKKSAKREMMR
jgi:hypothetical protein